MILPLRVARTLTAVTIAYTLAACGGTKDNPVTLAVVVRGLGLCAFEGGVDRGLLEVPDRGHVRDAGDELLGQGFLALGSVDVDVGLSS